MLLQHAARSAGHGAAASSASSLAPVGKRSLVEAVQLRGVATGPAAPGREPEPVKVAAAHGTSGPGGPLPHLDAIQRLFGRHDVRSIRAHVGGNAADGAQAMGAQAYATGDHVAFASPPDLHTAAHEAAHVVQQRAGVHLKGGVGEAGDAYEQHADAVADAVVAGGSAEALLDEKAPGAHGTARAGAIQRKSGFERTDAYQDPTLDQASRLIVKAVQQTPELQELLAFLKSDDNGAFIEFDTFNDPAPGSSYGKTTVLLGVGSVFHDLQTFPVDQLATIHRKTEVMIRIRLNVAKIGSNIEGGGADQTVGINEIINTLAHELTLHGTKFMAVARAVHQGTPGDQLLAMVAAAAGPGGELHGDVHHKQLLEGMNPEYEAIQRTIINLMGQEQRGGLDAKRYQRDIARDRATQAMGFELKRIQDRANDLYHQIVGWFGQAANGQSIDYPGLIQLIQAFLTDLGTWQMIVTDLPNRYPLLQAEGAETMFDAKYDQLQARREHVTQLMRQDMQRRGH